MFSQASIILSSGGVHLGRHTSTQADPRPRQAPPETTTVAEGTHPTGMYS